MTSPSQKLSFRNKTAFVISIIALCFFVPGIYLSMLTVSTKGSVNAQIPHLEKGAFGIPSVQGTEQKHINIKIFDTSRSILNTVHDLWKRNFFFVSSMIFLFSFIVPLVKSLLFSYIFFHKDKKNRNKIFKVIEAIGKWSMNDVFIVAIFLCYLSTGATSTENTKNVTMMGFNVNVDVMTGMHAKLQIGFWCFLAYCLLSLIAVQLYDPE